MDLDALSNEMSGMDIEQYEVKEYPPLIPGRTVHIDADFLAYMAAYERKDEDLSLEDIFYRADVMIMDKIQEAAAEFAILHLTPSTSDKGGRYEAAIQKKYQATREGEKPRHLEACRNYMGRKTGYVKGVLWHNAEADDGMAQAGWDSYYRGEQNLCIIATKDKDLRMVPCLHLNWDTGEVTGIHDGIPDLDDKLSQIETNSTFGWIGIKEKISNSGKKTKKHDGFGTKFFWFQLLMGDTADNIKGCPKAMIGGKLKACGLVGAYDLLKDAQSDAECLKICMAEYKRNKYVHWETGEPVEWVDVFWSEASLLWMQRVPGDISDAKSWIKEVLHKGKED